MVGFECKSKFQTWFHYLWLSNLGSIFNLSLRLFTYKIETKDSPCHP